MYVCKTSGLHLHEKLNDYTSIQVALQDKNYKNMLI